MNKEILCKIETDKDISILGY